MARQLKVQSSPKGGFFSGCKVGATEFLTAITIFNNFLLLSLAYFLGVGLSKIALLLATPFIKNKRHGKPDTYWSEIQIGGKPSDSYYRPF